MLRSITDRMRKSYQNHEAWFAVGVVLVLGILTYTTHIGKLGFYRDDWYSLWVGRAFGPQAIIDLFTFDRPFVGYVYSLSYRLLGENPLLWQIYALGIRTIGALAFLWMLRRLWPDHKIETATAAILLFIYPGFLQWANANTKSNQLTTYTLSILSNSLTVAALQARKIHWRVFFTLIAVSTAIGYWFLYEYMIGMEGMRLGIIAMLTWRKGTNKSWARNLSATFKRWLPYLVPLLLHLAWRLFFFESGRQGMNVQVALSAYQSGPFRTIVKRSLVLLIDVFEAVFSAWIIPLTNFTFTLGPADFLRAVVFGLVGMGIYTTFFLIAWSQKPAEPDVQQEPGTLIELTLLGAATLICTLIPVVAVGRDIRWESGFDKYTLHVIAGVAMLMVGVISLLLRRQQRALAFALFIGIALAAQFGNAVQWAQFWEDQRDLWWQLSWRAPQLEQGTVLLIEPPGKGFFEGYEIWGPANFVYNPGGELPRVLAEVYSPSTLEKIRVGTTESRGLREFFSFTRDFNNSLILSRPERTSCWHVLDGIDPVFPQNTSALLYATVRRSKLDRIVVDAPPSPPPTHIFGSEPAHTWCYYFQKASLQAQREDWSSVAALADQALDAELKPIDRSEWMPFLKGLVMMGRNDDAEEMALWIRDIATIRHRQCDYLSKTAVPDPERQSYLREILCQ